MPTPSVISQYQYSAAINRRYWDANFVYDNFQTSPASSAAVGGATSGTAGHQNVLVTAWGLYEWYVIGTQTALSPVLDTFGLNWAQTGTAGQGSEWGCGVTSQSNVSFLVNATPVIPSNPNPSPAFFLSSNWLVSTVAGANPLIVGFRKAAAFNATLSSYTDFAAIGIYGTAGEIQTVTNYNNVGLVVTDTTIAAVDATQFQLGVNVDSLGNVTYEYDWAAPTVTVPYQFQPNTTVVPFIRFTEASGAQTTQASINFLEIGFQS